VNIIFLFLVVFSMLAKKAIPGIHAFGGSDPTGLGMRTLSGLQSLGQMSIAWVALRLGEWTTILVMKGSILYSHDMVHIVNAAFLSILSVIAVVLLDFFADKSNEVVQPSLEETNDPSVASMALTDVNISKTWEHFRAASRDLSIIERALRSVIQSFGLLVGLCWERATDAAIDTIIEGSDLLNRHHVWSKILAAVLVLLVMGKAWLKYILPFSEMSADEHEMTMALETHSGKKMKQGLDKTLKVREAFVLKAVKGLDDKDLATFLAKMPELLKRDKEEFDHASSGIDVA
jgi:hypothetical protein